MDSTRLGSVGFPWLERKSLCTETDHWDWIGRAGYSAYIPNSTTYVYVKSNGQRVVSHRTNKTDQHKEMPKPMCGFAKTAWKVVSPLQFSQSVSPSVFQCTDCYAREKESE